MHAAWSLRHAGEKLKPVKGSFLREEIDDAAQKLNAFFKLVETNKLVGFMGLPN